MSVSSYLVPHIIVGCAVLPLYWVPMLARKGGRRHRRFGKLFLASLMAILVSVVPVILFRDGQLAGPAEFVRLLYLSVSLTTVGTVAWTSIRLKHDLARFRGPHFVALGAAMSVLGAMVLAAGIATGRPLPIILSSFGLVFGGAMLRFRTMRAAPQPMWWLSWHLNATCLLFSAVHGSLLSVAWRALVDPAAGPIVPCLTHGGTLLVALALRVGFGRKYGAPLRLGIAAQPLPEAA